MIGFVSRLFAREPVLSEAGPRDARALAALHAASFHRGWSDGEFERLLIDRNVVAHRATAGRSLVGFILSRLVRRRGGNPVGRRRRRPARAGDWRGSCSISICAGWRGSARARSSSRWTRATCRRAGSIGAPASGRSAAAKAITAAGNGAAALVLRRDLV